MIARDVWTAAAARARETRKTQYVDLGTGKIVCIAVDGSWTIRLKHATETMSRNEEGARGPNTRMRTH